MYIYKIYHCDNFNHYMKGRAYAGDHESLFGYLDEGWLTCNKDHLGGAKAYVSWKYEVLVPPWEVLALL